MYHIYPNGSPAYAIKHRKVTEFSEGVAVATREDSKMLFIDTDGMPLSWDSPWTAFDYVRPFRQGLAVVEIGERTAFHINKLGKPAYMFRFVWVGDFSENLAAAAKKARVDDKLITVYFHIKRSGRRAYRQNFRHAGSFRHGIAMMRDLKRRTVHIRTDGTRIRSLK